MPLFVGSKRAVARRSVERPEAFLGRARNGVRVGDPTGSVGAAVELGLVDLAWLVNQS
jgi:hypothetical protein